MVNDYGVYLLLRESGEALETATEEERKIAFDASVDLLCSISFKGEKEIEDYRFPFPRTNCFDAKGKAVEGIPSEIVTYWMVVQGLLVAKKPNDAPQWDRISSHISHLINVDT